jgi:hypothetical protein
MHGCKRPFKDAGERGSLQPGIMFRSWYPARLLMKPGLIGNKP